jgi:1,4-alpha-glucan branching enzyme
VLRVKCENGGNMLTIRKIKNKVRVTFSLPAQEGDESVYLVGHFNDWDVRATPMASTSAGNWVVEVSLRPNREYQFRYLVNGTLWRNDPAADSFVHNQYGSENSVVAAVGESHPRRTEPRKNK